MSNSPFNRVYELSELVSFVGDKIKAEEVTLETYISTDNMLIDRGGVEPATKLPAAARFNYYKVGDTLFSNIRTYFRKIWFAEFEGGASPDVLIFRSDDAELLDPVYLYFLMSNEDFINYTVLTAKGAKMPRGDKAAIMQYKFFLPDIDKQRKIGSDLLTINKKIQLNRQTNQTLEQIAQAIFKSWFVDFEPVKAKAQVRASVAEGRTPGSDQPLPKDFDVEAAVELAAMRVISGKTEEQLKGLGEADLQQLKTTAALFPDALVESELGEIPEGWEVTDLKSSTIELRRGISPKYTEVDGIRVINQKCIRNHSVNFELARLHDSLKKKIDGRQVEIGDVLVNSTGVGTLGRLAPVRYLPEPMVFDSHVTVVRADASTISKSFLTGLMLVKEVFIEASGAGSTGQTELSKQVLEEIRFAKPSLELGDIYHGTATPMNKHIADLEQQQIILAQTRDALLPKILSGEIELHNNQNMEVA